MVVPSPPFFPGPRPDPRPEMEPLSKETLRRAALDARKAFVRTLSDADRAQLEQGLAQHLTSLFAGVAVVGGYARSAPRSARYQQRRKRARWARSSPTLAS